MSQRNDNDLSQVAGALSARAQPRAPADRRAAGNSVAGNSVAGNIGSQPRRRRRDDAFAAMQRPPLRWP